MKKNKFMRLASGLLVGTLLTTCAISGTFAKYTTQDAANDSARVAKWGVELQLIGTMFGENYLDTTNTVTASSLASDISVQSNLSATVATNVDASEQIDNLVAPGTKATDVFSLKLNGTPEVDFEILASVKTQNVWLAEGTYGHMVKVDIPVTVENIADLSAAEIAENGGLFYSDDQGVTFTNVTASNDMTGLVGTANREFYTLEDKVVTDDEYFPVVYSTTGSTVITNDKDDYNVDTLAAVSAQIMQQLNNGTPLADTDASDYGYASEIAVGVAQYDSNQNITDLLDLGNVEFGWEWAYDRNVDGKTENTDGDECCWTCGADTVLGNIQSAELKVVKLQSDSTYKAPVEHTDYNLETSFDLDITVSQLD